MIRDYMRRLRPNAGTEAERRMGAPGGSDRGAVEIALRYNGLFDGAWYLRQNPDVAAAGMDPLEHFLSSGMSEGRDPSPLFSTSFYLTTYPDVAAADVHPLLHFITAGGSENRRPHPLVAPKWLRSRLPDGLPFDNPLLGLLMTRQRLGPRPLFDIDRVAAALGLPDEETPAGVLAAWFATAAGQRPDPHVLVSSAHIRRALWVPDEACAVEAYCRNRGTTAAPHPLIERDYSWERMPDLHGADDELTLLDAVLASPRAGEIDLTPMLDIAHYRRGAVARGLPADLGGVPPLAHYLETGAAMGIDPNPLFDEFLYRQRYLTGSPGVAGLMHYRDHGREPWMSLAPRFPDRFYVTRYPEVMQDFPGTPLLHYLMHGRAEGRKLREPAWSDDFDGWDQLREEVRAGVARWGRADPEVTVIVPVYNQFLYTLRCLWSMLRAGDRARLQVIVADDGSSDETAGFLRDLPGITYIRNPENMGFLQSCNNAAQAAIAPYVFLLNNDTAVLPGWIDSLLDIARQTPDAGIIGSKLVYPDGTLQEAGGYVWSDGGGANLGRGADPSEPGFSTRRDADYISGAAILVPRAVWRDVGGFDTRYMPAYCEDTDLAMRLRQLGWRVIYQPASVVVHFEGVSSGTSTDSGIKAYQVVNFEKLRERWAFALERHEHSQTIYPRNIPRARRPRILMIDHEVPEPDKDAGSVIAWWHIRLLLGMGYELTFVPNNLLPSGSYGTALQALGVELIHTPYVKDIGRYLDRHASDFDVFYLCRYGEGGRWIERLRQLCPATPIIFNTADLHFLRASREARLKGNLPEDMERVAAIRTRELQVIGMASDTILVSTHERDVLRDMGVRDSLSVIPLVMPVAERVPPREGRRGIAFVGGYRHTPNVDAVMYFLSDIWPLIQSARPDLEFHIVGSSPPAAFDALKLPGVKVVGYVEDLDSYLDGLVATIVPLQYGAGIKGKIGSSLAAGVPCISTTVGAEGMGLQPGSEIVIADSPEDFAAAVLWVVEDADLWDRLSRGGRDFVARAYSPEVTRRRLLRQLAKVGAAPFSGRCTITGAAEQRRFLHDDRPDSLAAGDGLPGSAERVAAQALARLAGQPDTALARIDPARLPALAVAGDMPSLADALAPSGRLVAPDAAELLAARIVLDDAAEDMLRTVLDVAGDTCTRLVLACAPVGQQPGTARAEAPRLMRLVLMLEAEGWDVRSDRMTLPECALTGCALIEARRPPPPTATA
ncbi:MAG: glycosyltransferase [Paracoccaceae bacterium]|nr:MAG: glycosyltransferase [Paracoccaceae bacterium]